MQYNFAIQNKKYNVEIGEIRGDSITVNVNGEVHDVVVENLGQLIPGQAVAQPVVAAAPRPVAARPAPVAPVAPAPAAPAAPMAAAGSGAVTAPIPGLILDIKVKIGDTIAAGQTVAIMEAMKMENNITSPVAGKVVEICAAKGAAVASGDVIMVIG